MCNIIKMMPYNGSSQMVSIWLKTKNLLSPTTDACWPWRVFSSWMASRNRGTTPSGYLVWVEPVVQNIFWPIGEPHFYPHFCKHFVKFWVSKKLSTSSYHRSNRKTNIFYHDKEVEQMVDLKKQSKVKWYKVRLCDVPGTKWFSEGTLNIPQGLIEKMFTAQNLGG